MYFPELESLANELPSVREQIAKIDDYLSKGKLSFVQASKVAYHTDLDINDFQLVASHLVERGFLNETWQLQCTNCSNCFSLNTAGHAYCDLCDIRLSEADCTKFSGYTVNTTESHLTDCMARLASCPDTVLSDLIKCIKNRSAIVLVGAGASIAASKNAQTASWLGLLEAGLKRCLELGNPKPSIDWQNSVRSEIDSQEVSLLISAAEKIQTELEKIHEFGKFLNETVGTLPIVDRTLIDSIAALGLPIMTTNYDSVFESITSMQTIRWNQPSQVEAWTRGDAAGILHVHGHFSVPESVIFGSSSYHNVSTNNQFQAMFKAIRSFKTIFYIGFGGGLVDPNFTQFFHWGEKIFSESNYRQYKFTKHPAPVLTQLEIDNRIISVEFGHEHSDLALFLHCLKNGPTLVKN